MEKVAIGFFNHPAKTLVTNSTVHVIGDFTEAEVNKLQSHLDSEGQAQLTAWQAASNDPNYRAFLAKDLLPKLQAARQAKLRQEAIQHQTDALLTAYGQGELDLVALTPKEFRLLLNGLPLDLRADLQSEKLMQLAQDTNQKTTTFLLYNSRANKIRNLFPLRGMDEIYEALRTTNDPSLNYSPKGWLRATLWRVFRKHV
jgi:hypothetical protein